MEHLPEMAAGSRPGQGCSLDGADRAGTKREIARGALLHRRERVGRNGDCQVPVLHGGGFDPVRIVALAFRRAGGRVAVPAVLVCRLMQHAAAGCGASIVALRLVAGRDFSSHAYCRSCGGICAGNATAHPAAPRSSPAALSKPVLADGCPMAETNGRAGHV